MLVFGERNISRVANELTINEERFNIINIIMKFEIRILKGGIE
jgi:hypothetical protein